MVEIKEIGIDELKQAFPVVCQLRPHLSEDEYIRITKIMITNGYQMFCLFENGKLVSYAGFAILTNLYYDNHIWVYELVTDEAKRSRGYGEMLLSHIEKYGKEKSLSCIALSSGVEREKAHNFYENSMDYDKVSYVFKKNLT